MLTKSNGPLIEQELRERADRLKHERLRLAVAKGLDDLENGRWVDLDGDTLDDYLDALAVS